jgi:hypothetical protein
MPAGPPPETPAGRLPATPASQRLPAGPPPSTPVSAGPPPPTQVHEPVWRVPAGPPPSMPVSQRLPAGPPPSTPARERVPAGPPPSATGHPAGQRTESRTTSNSVARLRVTVARPSWARRQRRRLEPATAQSSSRSATMNEAIVSRVTIDFSDGNRQLNVSVSESQDAT